MVKVERTFPAPESLAIEAQKRSGSYSKEDVINQLLSDFHNKCYICGLSNLQDGEVEHLLPHFNGKFPDRKYGWENLFWACGHCNNVKNKPAYYSGVIDCCKVDPELRIDFILENERVIVKAKNPEDMDAVTTAHLVEEVFNLKNTGPRTYKCAIRYNALNKEMNKLYDALECLESEIEKNLALRKLKVLLKRESQFAAFKRRYIRENKDKFPELQEYIA